MSLRPFTGPTNEVNIGDDNSTGAISLGFTFYGYTTCYVGTNGGVTFQEPFNAQPYYSNFPLFIYSHTPQQVWQFGHGVYPFWCDLVTGEDTGRITYGALNGGFGVTWESLPIYDIADAAGDDRRNTFQVVIYPSGCVEMNYGTLEVDVGKQSLNNVILTGSYDSPARTEDDDFTFYWPIAGYSLPTLGDFLQPRPEPPYAFFEGFPTDPIRGSGYLEQGLSGFTEGGANSLAEGTNCGIAGRWLFGPCGALPPLRQNQRDDARQNQRTSRQLTVRQRGYL